MEIFLTEKLQMTQDIKMGSKLARILISILLHTEKAKMNLTKNVLDIYILKGAKSTLPLSMKIERFFFRIKKSSIFAKCTKIGSVASVRIKYKNLSNLKFSPPIYRMI